MSARTILLPRRPRRNRGVSLLVVMVMVLVLGLMSALGLRAAIFSTKVTGNARSQALALEAAEAALRYCEIQALSATPSVTIWDPPDDGGTDSVRWQAASNWGTSKISTALPEAWVNTSLSKQKYALPPECLVERLRLPIEPEFGRDAFVITARGFSPNASVSSSGELRSGSDVWIQSTIQY